MEGRLTWGLSEVAPTRNIDRSFNLDIDIGYYNIDVDIDYII